MKKSVVVLIAVIYIASIALVSFFGLQYKMFEEVVSVERIEILNEGLRENDKWGKFVIISPNNKGEWKYLIKYRVYPDNATTNRVEFTYDTQNPYASVDETGLVTLTKAGSSVKVTLIATDGSNISTSITVVAKQ